MTETEWLDSKLAEYKSSPEETLWNLLLNTNDAMNDFLKNTQSEQAFALLVTACTMNNRFLAEAEKQKKIIIELVN